MIPMAQCKNENVWPLFQKQEKSVVIDTKTSFNGFSLILLWSFFFIAVVFLGLGDTWGRTDTHWGLELPLGSSAGLA